MSWDLYIGDDWIGNYTHNLNAAIRAASVAPHDIGEPPAVAAEVLFHAPTLGTCFGDFDGRPAREAALFCAYVREEIERNPDPYRKYEPENKWGTLDSLCKFLRNVEEACLARPDEKFEASG